MENKTKHERAILRLLADSPRVEDWVKCADLILHADEPDQDLVRQVAEQLQSARALESPEALHALGLLHQSDSHGLRDWEKAEACFLRAAEKGCADAEYELGHLYDPTGFVSNPERRNAIQAEKWFLAAARRHHPQAYTALKSMRFELDANPKTSHHWRASGHGRNRGEATPEAVHEAFSGLAYRQWVYDRAFDMDEANERTILGELSRVCRNSSDRFSSPFPKACLFAITAEAPLSWCGHDVFLVSPDGIFFSGCKKEFYGFGPSSAEHHAVYGIPFDQIEAVHCQTNDYHPDLEINGNDLGWLSEVLIVEDVEAFCAGLVALTTRIAGKPFHELPGRR